MSSADLSRSMSAASLAHRYPSIRLLRAAARSRAKPARPMPSPLDRDTVIGAVRDIVQSPPA